jgi:F0F1-type ATP synthase membrane subunit b/b'
MDFDVTLFLQFGLFLFILVVISKVLLEPLQQVLEERHKKIDGAREDIERLRKLAMDDMEAYQERIRDARDEAFSEREKLLNEGREKEREMLAQVRAEIADMLNGAREKVDVAEMEARKALSEDTTQLARQMVGKLLGREVQG